MENLFYTDAKKIEVLTEQVQITIRTLRHIRAFHHLPVEVTDLLDLKIIAAEQTLQSIKESDEFTSKMGELKHAS